MTQQELEALLAQIAPNNDPRRLVFSEATETVEHEVPGPYVGADPVKSKAPVRVLQWTDPGTGQTLKVLQNPSDGTYTKTFQGIDPKQQGAPATTPAQQAQEELGTEVGTRQVTDANGQTVKVTTYRRSDGTTYDRTDTVQAAPAKPAVAAGTLNTTSPNYATVQADGSLTWTKNPNYQNPSPKPIALPNTRTIIWDNGDGTTRTEKNAAYVKPSKIMAHPADPTRMINVTEDDDGNPVILPVTDQTTIKPVDIPVLQAKYGEIAQGLGALAADLNGRFARGDITAQQRSEAFQAAKQQAEVQVSELNGILSNSRAVWGQQIEQRGQTLSDTAGRRTYAGNVLQNSLSFGGEIARSAGPGHGAEMAQGIGALLGIGQRYAEGMGGLRESPEIPLPVALQQAQGIGLPGYGAAGAGPAASGAATATPPPPPAPSLPSDASVPDGGGGLPAPLLRPPPPVAGSVAPTPQGLAAPTAAPVGAGMQQQLLAALGFGGSPVAAGGQGLWDPDQEMSAMVGDGSDPGWAAAVQAAARDFRRPAVGSGVESGYRRFG